MNCPVCGEQLPCIHGRKSAALLADEQIFSDAFHAASENADSYPARGESWRKEVASRVQLHRARRRRGGDTDAAMEFDFAAEEALAVTEEPVVRERPNRRDRPSREEGDPAVQQVVIPRTRKIIRFPIQSAAPGYAPSSYSPEPEIAPPEYVAPPRIVEEAENLVSEPESAAEFERIAPLQPAEQLELLPSFDDIQLEPGHYSAKIETEVVPRPASLQQRFFAGLVDVIVVVLAAASFDLTFVRLAEDDPHSRMALLCGVVVSAALWILFQYIFLVHGRGTPGMRLAQLQLATFEGKPASTWACRCRALASTLSALSIGLGYVWALFDEDQLGWHDRITRTLVCSSIQPSETRADIWD
jgi:uncharacterized RDD family membrane protein YckC